MTRGRLREAVVRSAILFAVSVVLVLAFWFHAEFYQLGLLPLTLVGGLAVFGVFALLWLTFSPQPLLHRRDAGRLEFDRGAVSRILGGTQTACLRPLDETVRPRVGGVYGAWPADGEKRVARLRLVDARRVLVRDVPEAVASEAGHESVSAFLSAWEREGHETGPDALALLLRFDVMEGRA